MAELEAALSEIRQELAQLREGVMGASGLKATLNRRLNRLHRELQQELSQHLRQSISDILPEQFHQFAPDITAALLPRLADGGVIDGPRQIALAGEAGPEAVLPLQRSADGRLGVILASPENASQPPPPPAVNIHIHNNSDDGFAVAENLELDAVSDLVGEALSALVTQKISEVLDEQNMALSSAAQHPLSR